MSNMSYCRFENTLADLRDCAEAIDDPFNGDDLSETEAQAKEALIELCCDIAEQVGNARDDGEEPLDCEVCLSKHGIPEAWHGERDIYMEECNTCTK